MTMTYERLRDDNELRSEFNSFSLADKREIFKQMAPPTDGDYSDQDLQGIQKALMMKTSEPDEQVPLQPGTQTVNDIPMSWSQVGSEALSNLDDSAIEYGKNLWQAMRHPIETGQQLYGLMAGAVEKAIPGGEDKHAEILENTTNFFKERYGGTNFGEVVESIKRTMAEDPVGFLSDLSVVIAGPGTAVKVAQVAGKAAKVAKIAKAGSAGAKITSSVDKVANTIRGITDKLELVDPATLATRGAVKGTSKVVKGLLTKRKVNRKLNDAMQQALNVDGDLIRNEDIAKAAIEQGVNITEKDMIRMARNRNKLGKEIERGLKDAGRKGTDPLFHRDELVVAFDRVLDDTSRFKLEGANKPEFIARIEKLKEAFIKSSPERFSAEELAKMSQGIKFEPESLDKFNAPVNQVNQQKKMIISSLLGEIFPEVMDGKKKGKLSERFTTKKGKKGSPEVTGAMEEFGWEQVSKQFGIAKDINELIKSDIRLMRSKRKTGAKGIIVGGSSNVMVGLGAGAVGFGLHGVPGAIGYTLSAIYLSKLFENPAVRLGFTKKIAKMNNMRLSAAKKLVDQRITDYMAELQRGAQQAGRVANIQEAQ